MPSIAALTINDGSTDKTYSPVAKSGNVTTFRDSSAASAAGMPTLVVSYDTASASRKSDKLKLSLNVPYEITVDGAPVVEHIARAWTEVVLPSAVPSSECDRIAALIGNAVTHATIAAMIADREGLY